MVEKKCPSIAGKFHDCALLLYGLCCRVHAVAMDTGLNPGLSVKELMEKLDDKRLCLEVVITPEHIMLPPKYLGSIAQGIHEQIGAKLKLYSEK